MSVITSTIITEIYDYNAGATDFQWCLIYNRNVM